METETYRGVVIITSGGCDAMLQDRLEPLLVGGTPPCARVLRALLPRPLDDGEPSLGRARAPARGPTAVPSPWTAAIAPLRSLFCEAEREKKQRKAPFWEFAPVAPHHLTALAGAGGDEGSRHPPAVVS
jgi:hypothetical protein